MLYSSIFLDFWRYKIIEIPVFLLWFNASMGCADCELAAPAFGRDGVGEMK